jgi:hypothetical protein
MLQNRHSMNAAVRDVFSSTSSRDVAVQAPTIDLLQALSQGQTNVAVPETALPINTQQVSELLQLVDPLAESPDNAINLFCLTLDFVTNALQHNVAQPTIIGN